MEKQKKQLIGLLVVLIVAVIAFIVISKLPSEEESEDKESYVVTALDSDAVTKLVYTNESGTVSLTKSGSDWICEEDKGVDIDEDTVNNMVSMVASLTSENKLENVTDVSQYGLDNPTLKILISDGSDSYTIFVGDYNETTYTYYLCLESDMSTVYTTQSGTISDFQNNTLTELTAEEETQTDAETAVEETAQTQITTEAEEE